MRKRSGLSVFLIPLLCTILAIWLVVSCMGCKVDKTRQQQEDAVAADYALQRLVYIEDARTKLCFAVVADYLDYERGYIGLANVPCEKVKNFFTPVGKNTPR